MNIFRGKNIIILALFILATLPSGKVQALTISPARFEIETSAGNEVSGEMILLNEQLEARTFYSSFENFEANGDTGAPNFIAGKTGLASWISADSSVTLNPGEEKKLPFKIKVPSDARPGGYFAAIFWGTTPVESTTNNISVGARIGMLVLLRVSGDVKEEGGINEIDTESGEVLFSSLPIKLTYTFTNDGDDRLNPKGSIIIRNIFGIKVAELNANPADGNILPRSSRKYEVSWGEEKEKDGFFQSALYELKHFAVGPYKVVVDLTYGAKGELSDRASKYIWFFPWQIILIIFFLLLLAWVLFVKIVKTRRRMIRKQRMLEAKIKELEKMAGSNKPNPSVNSMRVSTKPFQEVKNSRKMRQQ